VCRWSWRSSTNVPQTLRPRGRRSYPHKTLWALSMLLSMGRASASLQLIMDCMAPCMKALVNLWVWNFVCPPLLTVLHVPKALFGGVVRGSMAVPDGLGVSSCKLLRCACKRRRHIPHSWRSPFELAQMHFRSDHTRSFLPACHSIVPALQTHQLHRCSSLPSFRLFRPWTNFAVSPSSSLCALGTTLWPAATFLQIGTPCVCTGPTASKWVPVCVGYR